MRLRGGRLAAAVVCFSVALATAQTPLPASADRDWQTILELASGPGTKFADRAQALSAAAKHLDRQEQTLRSFIAQYPDDPHRYSARIRLAGVLYAKAKFSHKPELRADGTRILNDLRADPKTPPPICADAAFEGLSETMQDYVGRSDDEARSTLLAAVRQYGTDFPDDRRFASAMVEVSTMYDDDPAQKSALLEEALARTTDPRLHERIGDDFRRLSQLGKPVEARLKPWRHDSEIDLAHPAGRAAVLLFWASWSAPSLRELAKLEEVSKDFTHQPLEFYTVTLDDDPTALDGAVRASGLTWPTQFDGKGWKGELVRLLGINALPTVWVLDRSGRLLTLNARDHEAEWIKRALE